MFKPVFNKSVYSLLNYRYGFTHIMDPVVWNSIFKKLDYASYFKDLSKLQAIHMYPNSAILPIELENYLANGNPKGSGAKHILMEHGPKARAFINDKLLNGKIKNAAATEAKTKPKSTRGRKKKPDPTEVINEGETADLSLDNIVLTDKNPYIWESFPELIEEKILNPETQTRDHLHTKMLITGNYTNKLGEGLAVQHIGCIANKNWLQRYGLVRMLMIVSQVSALKMLTDVGNRTRMGVMFEAFADCRLVAVTETPAMAGGAYGDKRGKAATFFTKERMEKDDPVIIRKTDGVLLSKTEDIAVIDVRPKDVPMDLNMEHFDYVTKQLFMMRSTPLYESIELLGPGALLFYDGEPEFASMRNLMPMELTVDQLYTLTNLFQYWPFKPEILLDFAEDQTRDIIKK